jgi:hypothetical protein
MGNRIIWKMNAVAAIRILKNINKNVFVFVFTKSIFKLTNK